MPLERKLSFLRQKLSSEEIQEALNQYKSPLPSSSSKYKLITILSASLLGTLSAAYFLVFPTQKPSPSQKSAKKDLDSLSDTTDELRRGYFPSLEEEPSKLQKLFQEQVENLEKFTNQLSSLQNSLENLSKTLTVDFEPAFALFLENFYDEIDRFRGVQSLYSVMERICDHPGDTRNFAIDLGTSEYRGSLGHNPYTTQVLSAAGFAVHPLSAVFNSLHLSRLLEASNLVFKTLQTLESSPNLQKTLLKAQKSLPSGSPTPPITK